MWKGEIFKKKSRRKIPVAADLRKLKYNKFFTDQGYVKLNVKTEGTQKDSEGTNPPGNWEGYAKVTGAPRGQLRSVLQIVQLVLRRREK